VHFLFHGTLLDISKATMPATIIARATLIDSIPCPSDQDALDNRSGYVALNGSKA
jgi:hypothetical protein